MGGCRTARRTIPAINAAEERPRCVSNQVRLHDNRAVEAAMIAQRLARKSVAGRIERIAGSAMDQKGDSIFVHTH
jgi:hypothetical protein